MAIEAKTVKEKINLSVFKKQLDALNPNDIPSLFIFAAKFNMPEIIETIHSWSQNKAFYNPATQKKFCISEQLNQPDQHKVTALDYAVEAGHCNIVKLLFSLDKNLDINRLSPNGRTLIGTAIHYGHRDIVTFLQNKGVAFTQDHFKTAIISEKFEIASDIFNKIKTTTQELCELLSLAAKLKQDSFLQKTLKKLNETSDKRLNWDEMINMFGKTVLGHAINYGNLNCVRTLIDLGKANPNVLDSFGLTALHNAAWICNPDLIQFLLSRGAEVDNVSYEGKTPLFIAVEQEQIHTILLLLKCKADINKSVKGETVLSMALKKSDFDLSYLLYRKGAHATKQQKIDLLCLAISKNKEKQIEEFLKICEENLDIPCATNNHTPLMYAARTGNLKLVQFLLQRKCDPNFTPQKNEPKEILDVLSSLKSSTDINSRQKLVFSLSSGPLHEAAMFGDPQIASVLIKCGAKIEAKNLLEVTPLEVASGSGHLEMVKCLLKSGAKINHRSLLKYTSLFWAVMNNHKMIALLLRSHGADIQLGDRNHTPLARALKNGFIEISVLLFHLNEKVTDSDYINLLCLGAELNRPTLIRHLLDRDHKRNHLINRTGSHGWTPLSLAVHKGHQNIVMLLLKYKADVNQLNTDKSDPLHIAIQSNQYDIANMLLEAGAQIEQPDINGFTALSLAANNGLINMVALLLNKGAKINHYAKGSGTPLFLAVQKGHLPIVDMLVRRKADQSIKGVVSDEIGDKRTGEYTPFILACSHEKVKIAKILLSENKDNAAYLHKLVLFLHIRNQLLPKYKVTPRNIYFIWVGGPIPNIEYLANIMQLAALASKSNYTINLVVENPHNYYKASAIFDINIPNLKFCHFSQCLEKMKADPFYQDNLNLLKQFQSCILREAVGFKNLSAISDFLRVEVLRQTGGLYFDTDTKFIIGKLEILFPQYAEEGILLHCKHFKNTDLKDDTGEPLDIYKIAMTNDIMCSAKGHEALSNSLTMMLKEYRKLDNTPWKNMPYKRTLQDKKRFLILDDKENHSVPGIENINTLETHAKTGLDDRRSLTLEIISGTTRRAATQYAYKNSRTRYADLELNKGRLAQDKICFTSIPEPIIDSDSTHFHETGTLVSGILARHGADQYLARKNQKTCI